MTGQDLSAQRGTAQPTTRPWRYALGMFGNSIPINMYNTYMTYFYVDKLGLDMRIYAGVMLFYAFFDALDNPVYGYLSDRTRTRWGRRKPWLLAGCPMMFAAFVAFFSPPAVKGTPLAVYFIIFLLLVETLNSMLLTNYGALLPDLFRTDEEQTRANAIRQGFQVVAMILGIALTPVIAGKIGYAFTAVLFGALGMGSLAFSVLGCHERHDYEEVKKPLIWESLRQILSNKKFWVTTLTNAFYSGGMSLVMAGIPFFVKYVLHEGGLATTILSGTVLLVAVASVFIWSRLVPLLTLRRAWRLALLVLAASFVPMCFVTTLPLAVACGVAVGFGFAGVITTMDVVGAQVLMEDNARTGNRREGVFQSLGGFLNRLSGVFKSGAFFLVFALFGFQSGDAPGPHPDWSSRFILAIAPCVLIAISFLLSGLLRLTRGQPQPENEAPPTLPSGAGREG